MEQHIQRYTKYIHEALRGIEVDTATYKDHLHRVFEWYSCIQLTKQSGHCVVRWEDIPANLREQKNMTRDMGIDAWDIEGDRVVQMKLYSGKIGWRDLSTFIAAWHLSFENCTKLLYRNTESKVCNQIRAMIECGKLQDMPVTDAVFREECRAIQTHAFPPLATQEPDKERAYQEEAIAMMNRAKQEGKNVTICLPTGTGKTQITIRYHQEHAEETMLVLVPTIVLMEQWGDVCCARGIVPYLIGTGKHHDLTDYAEESIVICVYDSYANIYLEAGRFQRFVVDEAHHLLTPERYQENTINDSEGLSDEESEEEDDIWEEDTAGQVAPIRKISYLSRIRALHATECMIYLSATIDKPADGLFYEYKVRQAIEEGYLCDYQFVFPIFAQECAAHGPLAEYLVYRQQEMHCLIYAPSRETGKAFAAELNKMQMGCAGYIDGYTTSAARKKILAEFEAGTIRFMVNIRVLVEGYDAPHIRSVFFLHISSSDLFTIQAIGRALRLHADKMNATIYVPFTQEEDIGRIQAFLRHLGTYDERIKKSMMEKKEGGYLRVERGEEEDEDADTEFENTEVVEFRYNLVMDSMGRSGKWEEIALQKALAYRVFYETNKYHPRAHRDLTSTQNQIEYQHALFMQRMKKAKRKIGTCMLYPSVEKIFIELLGDGWFESKNRHNICIQRAHEYIKWTHEHGLRPKDKTRAPDGKKKEKLEPEEALESKLTVWFKKAKERTNLHPEIEKIMQQLGEQWRVNNNKECESLIRANEFINWCNTHKRKPLIIQSRDRDKQVTDERQVEHTYAQWYRTLRLAKRRPKSTTLIIYPQVEGILVKQFGENWYA